MNKRLDYISWDTYFMEIAKLSSKRSKDPNTQVGACIVSNNNRILGIGYNGLPNGISDDVIPWTNEGTLLDTKYPYVVHAEANAILNTNNFQLLNTAKIYVTLFPCSDCAKLIIQAGIKEVIYLEDKYPNGESTLASKKLFKLAKINVISYEEKISKVR